MTIEQFATELKMPPGALIEQLAAAGMGGKAIGDRLTEQDKTRLLDYLRKQHGALSESKKRITLTRKQTSEIRAADSSGKARTIQVEVRKKRVLMRREDEAPAPAVALPEPPSSSLTLTVAVYCPAVAYVCESTRGLVAALTVCVLPSPQLITALCVSAAAGSLKVTVSVALLKPQLTLTLPTPNAAPTVGGTFVTFTVADDCADKPPGSVTRTLTV